MYLVLTSTKQHGGDGGGGGGLLPALEWKLMAG